MLSATIKKVVHLKNCSLIIFFRFVLIHGVKSKKKRITVELESWFLLQVNYKKIFQSRYSYS